MIHDTSNNLRRIDHTAPPTRNSGRAMKSARLRHMLAMMFTGGRKKKFMG